MRKRNKLYSIFNGRLFLQVMKDYVGSGRSLVGFTITKEKNLFFDGSKQNEYCFNIWLHYVGLSFGVVGRKIK